MGALHGLLLSSVVVAGTAGPALLSALRESEMLAAVHSLAASVDPAVFHATFGAPLTDLHTLVAAKTVTVARLLEVAPLGTLDPTPFVYDKPF